ncbi:MAG: NAD(P)-binding domain-containing protein [Legionellales bacterium]|jgi:hypothetical protein
MYDLDSHPFRVEAEQASSSTSALAVSGYLSFQNNNNQKTPQKFPRLLVLNQITARLRSAKKLPDFEGTIFIGVQHLLKTTGSLFESLINLGAKPENMYFAGKCYSTSPQVADSLRKLGMHIIDGSKPERWGEYIPTHNQDIKKLWEMCRQDLVNTGKKVNKIIIVDDGAGAIENAPSFFTNNNRFKIVAIEQTCGGIFSKIEQMPEYPVINIAQSAAKRELESTFIQEAVLDKLGPTIQDINKFMRIGIVGLGATGGALIKKLLNDGYTLLVYDENPKIMEKLPHTPNLKKASSLSYLLLHSDYIFGCSGRDITTQLDLLPINGRDRTLINCSSDVNEFNTLLKAISAAVMTDTVTVAIDPLLDIKVTTVTKYKICIKNGGFPVNFDSSGASVSENKVTLTCGLVLGAILQAALLLEKNTLTSEDTMLDPVIQRYVALTWQTTLPDSEISQLPLQHFRDLTWIVQYSQGKHSQSMMDNVFFTSQAPRPSRIRASL